MCVCVAVAAYVFVSFACVGGVACVCLGLLLFACVVVV